MSTILAWDLCACQTFIYLPISPVRVHCHHPIKTKNNKRKYTLFKQNQHIAWFHISHKAFSEISQWYERVRLRTHGCRRDLGHGESDLQWPRPLSSVGTGWTWTCFHIHPVGVLWGWLSRLPVNRMQICKQSLQAVLLTWWLNSWVEDKNIATTKFNSLPVYIHRSVSA